MGSYTKVNLKSDVPNMAEQFGIEGLEARFGRKSLETAQHGVSYFRFPPDFRTPFGHKHAEQEEVYVLVSGSARIKIEDETVELALFDAVRVPADAARCVEGGPEGAELIITGAPAVDNDGEMLKGWWSD